MIDYKMVPIVDFSSIEDELKELYPDREFNLLTDLLDYPQNDSCAWFSTENYPLEKDGIYSDEYVELYNMVCGYLAQLDLPSHEILIDVSW